MQPQSVSVGYASSAGLHRECQCDDSDFLFKIVLWHIEHTHTTHTNVTVFNERTYIEHICSTIMDIII